MENLKRQFQNAVYILATGYILFFVSEPMFWCYWRKQNTLPDTLITWLAYSLIAWACLILTRTFRVASFLAVFLVGAVYGWLAEGVLTDTVFGDGGNPFPLSLSFTGLAWHALLGVGVVWYGLHRVLASGDARRFAGLTAGVGAIWGLWSVWWRLEPGEIRSTSLLAFASHTFTFSVFFIVAWWLVARGSARGFQTGKAGTIVAALALLAWFVGVRLPATPLSVVVLPPLLGLCVIGLRRHRERQQPALCGFLEPQTVRFGAREAGLLLLMPLVALLINAASRLLPSPLPTNILAYVVTMPLGFWLLFHSLYVAFRPARANG